MSEHTKTVQAECDGCGGTGLYVGLGERDGFAVQCHRCSGTGERTLTFGWRDFEGRKARPGVLRVLQTNPGIVAGLGNAHTPEDFGGMPYTEWRDGRPFPPGSEMRAFTCPAWWYQSADYARKPDWPECGFGGRFSDCRHFPDKAGCWSRWDRENPAGEIVR
jgi:hypothetical protein